MKTHIYIIFQHLLVELLLRKLLKLLQINFCLLIILLSIMELLVKHLHLRFDEYLIIFFYFN